MRVALSWWPPQTAPGGRSQAIRGNVLGFLEAGHDVDLYWPSQLEEFRDRADEYDLIVAPYYDIHFDDVDVPHILQMGGWDSPDRDPGYFKEAFQRADILTSIDPGLVEHFQELVDLDPAAVSIVPNAPNRRLFDVQDHGAEEGFVLVPKIGGPYKTADLLNQVAGGTYETTFEAHVAGDPPPLHRNVVKRPGVPLSTMPRRYARSTIVLNPSERETGPNVAVEAFLSQRPFVATSGGIGDLLTLPKEEIASFTPGLAATEYLSSATAEQIGAGEHYLATRPEILRELIPELMHDVDWRHDLARRGREWVDAWDYTWADKAAALVDLVDEREK